jgi:hypothetical protein
LPPPEGELTTKSVPRETGELLTWVAVWNSFTLLDILDLFAKFFDLCLYCQPSLFDH